MKKEKPCICVHCKLSINEKVYYENNLYDLPTHRDCRKNVNKPFRHNAVSPRLPEENENVTG